MSGWEWVGALEWGEGEGWFAVAVHICTLQGIGKNITQQCIDKSRLSTFPSHCPTYTRLAPYHSTEHNYSTDRELIVDHGVVEWPQRHIWGNQ